MGFGAEFAVPLLQGFAFAVAKDEVMDGIALQSTSASADVAWLPHSQAGWHHGYRVPVHIIIPVYIPTHISIRTSHF